MNTVMFLNMPRNITCICPGTLQTYVTSLAYGIYLIAGACMFLLMYSLSRVLDFIAGCRDQAGPEFKGEVTSPCKKIREK